MRFWFLIFLLFGFYGSDFRMSSGQEVQHPQPIQYVVPYVAYAPLVVAPPPVIYQPQIQYIPYQYMGTSIYQKQYHTPLRNALFGRYRLNHYYSPQVQ